MAAMDVGATFLPALYNTDPVAVQGDINEDGYVLEVLARGPGSAQPVPPSNDVGGSLAALGNQRAIGEVFQLAGPRAFTWDEAVGALKEALQSALAEKP